MLLALNFTVEFMKNFLLCFGVLISVGQVFAGIIYSPQMNRTGLQSMELMLHIPAQNFASQSIDLSPSTIETFKRLDTLASMDIDPALYKCLFSALITATSSPLQSDLSIRIRASIANMLIDIENIRRNIDTYKPTEDETKEAKQESVMRVQHFLPTAIDEDDLTK